MTSHKNKSTLSRGKALTLFIVFVAISALAVSSTTLFQTSGSAGFKLLKDTATGIRSTSTTSQDYELYRSFKDSGDELFLVSSKKTVYYNLDAEGIDGNISWNVRTGQKLQSVLWSKTEQATELNVNHSLGVLVTGLGGCCGAMTGFRLWDIAAGNLLMSFNSFVGTEKVIQPFSLEVPNSTLKARYVGVLSGDSTRDRDFVAPVAGKQAIALIKYASDSLKQKFQLDIETADGYSPSILYVTIEKDPAIPNSEQIEINNEVQAVLWNINGSTNPSDISGVILKITMDAGFGEKIVRIPVRQDELKEDLAEVPPGVQLRLL